MSMPKRKGGWERALESKKKKKKDKDLLAKTHKLTSFFQVADNDVGTSSGDIGDIHDQSPPISPTPENDVTGDDKESAATKEVSNEYVPKDVGLFGNLTETLRETCVRMGTDHFRNVANDYPETKRDFSGVNRCLNPSAFKKLLPNG